MSTTKRILAIFATACLLLVTLTACGGSGVVPDGEENIIISVTDQSRQESGETYFMLEDDNLCSIDKDGKITFLETYDGEPLLNDDGTVLVDDDYIYFHVDTVDTTDGEVALAKRKASGGDITILRRIGWNWNTGKPNSLQLEGDFLYYRIDDQLCRVKTDGGSFPTMTMNPPAGQCIVKDGWIFYDTYSGEAVYKVRFGETQTTPLTQSSLQGTGAITLLAIIENSMYLESKYELWIGNLDGKLDRVAGVSSLSYPKDVRGEWLFWKSHTPLFNGIYKTRLTAITPTKVILDGKPATTFVATHGETPAWAFPDTVIGDWCYANIYHASLCIRFSLDGTRFQVLQNNTMNLTHGEELIYSDVDPTDYNFDIDLSDDGY